LMPLCLCASQVYISIALSPASVFNTMLLTEKLKRKKGLKCIIYHILWLSRHVVLGMLLAIGDFGI
jgi:hypothetical protein